MNKEEFFNFLSLISAFKDVVIGEETPFLRNEINLSEKDQTATGLNNELYQMTTKHTEENLENNKNEELNPEEWDPW